MENQTLVKVTIHQTKVAVVQLNRPEKRNAFSQQMINETITCLESFGNDSNVHAVIITGQPGGPFSAGMDLNELIRISTAEAHRRNFLKDLTDAFARFSKPIIASVEGYALGAGCEVALACDIIYAAEDALFGLPEVKIGTIPGAGGTQRLARALGKHKSMEFILTGDSISGAEFERFGVVSKVFPKQEDVLAASLKLAERIASLSAPVISTAKQAVLTVENSHLDAGMSMEKSLYYSTFGFEDFQEGLKAFLEKRGPNFTHK